MTILITVRIMGMMMAVVMTMSQFTSKPIVSMISNSFVNVSSFPIFNKYLLTINYGFSLYFPIVPIMIYFLNDFNILI